MINNSEKGVSLIITFFIMTIILSVVMAISTILYSEIKIIRNIGNSVVSFFAADGGVEKVLYYDRYQIPSGATRGLCNICNSCPTSDPDSSINCINCVPSGIDCIITTCTDCAVSFNTTIEENKKSYNVDATVSPNGEFTDFFINSYGLYNNVKRAIELFITE